MTIGNGHREWNFFNGYFSPMVVENVFPDIHVSCNWRIFSYLFWWQRLYITSEHQWLFTSMCLGSKGCILLQHTNGCLLPCVWEAEGVHYFRTPIAVFFYVFGKQRVHITSAHQWLFSSLFLGPARGCEKDASDLGLGDVIFTGYSSFLDQLQLASNDVPAIWRKK